MSLSVRSLAAAFVVVSAVITMFIIFSPAAMAQSTTHPHLQFDTIAGTVLGGLSSFAALYFVIGTLYNLFTRGKGKTPWPGAPTF
ncbi:hypothetical protein CMUST_12705 [Corynebacterium mustelae]|uniref:Uncharacterized protein n=1 Tax=Corynebacterium mustelae TaxID=571915 RepID=A0A0G3H268_9CORY|nr:hypothetical protein [Corynebacterium mustelae]AKK06845.1 hypothetical protein CMUST_12705 [Corynebacterium mustelae]